MCVYVDGHDSVRVPEARSHSKDHGLPPSLAPTPYLMLLTLLRWRKATGVKSAGRKASVVVVARSCVAVSRTARRACILCVGREEGREKGRGGEVSRGMNEKLLHAKQATGTYR